MSTLAPLTVAALDLDDTLLRSDGSLSPRTLATLRQWLASGRRLVIATGRPHRSVAPVLPAEFHNTPLICYNGAEIHIDGHKIFENLIPPETVRSIVEQVQSTAPAAIVGLEVKGELYLNRAMQRASPYHVADLLEVAVHPAAKVLIFGQELEPVTPLLAELPAAAKALLSARYQFIQILAAGANKATALAVLMGDWDVLLAQVVAFGDDTNDIEMIQECGLGVAVANAVDEVKAVANLVTGSNDEDGVAIVLEQLLDGTMVV